MTDHSASVQVRNAFDNPATIVLRHRSGDNADETATWQDVAFNASGEPALEVHYETGVLSPFDYWQVTVVVTAGPNQGTWENSGWKECYLKDSDQGLTHVFTVGADTGFNLSIASGPCQTDLVKVS